jgi:imidazole glycerol phosphate synthase subunit HisF
MYAVQQIKKSGVDKITVTLEAVENPELLVK